MLRAPNLSTPSGRRGSVLISREMGPRGETEGESTAGFRKEQVRLFPPPATPAPLLPPATPASLPTARPYLYPPPTLPPRC